MVFLMAALFPMLGCGSDEAVTGGSDAFVIPQTGYSTPTSYPGMTLVWQDEFDGVALNTTDYWTFETGTATDGWGNHELEYYQPGNTALKDGYLVIEAKKENVESSAYTSSRIKTQFKKSFRYGRVDIRALLPKGKGIWPALWMLGSNITLLDWPACGEIDIMEMIGGGSGDKTVYGTAHWDQAGRHESAGGNKPLSDGIFNDAFHVFSIVWTAASIKWYIDDVEYYTIDITPTQFAAFHKDFFLLFNVAVGGDWPGSPDDTTVFPQRMIVDYVRVFQ